LSRRFGLLFQIQIGHPHQLFHIRTADERFAQHGHLLVHIGLHHQGRHQGLQNGLGVHINAGAGLKTIGHHKAYDHANGTQSPSQSQT
jgi:hypothetical protein